MSYAGRKRRFEEDVGAGSDSVSTLGSKSSAPMGNVDRKGVESLATLKESFNPTTARPYDDSFSSHKIEFVHTTTSNYGTARELMFTFNSNGTEQLDLANTTFTVKLQVMKKNGEAYDTDIKKLLGDNAYLRENVYHNLWSDIEIYINNQLVKLPNSDYARTTFMRKAMTIEKDELDYEKHSVDFQLMQESLDPNRLPPTTAETIGKNEEKPYIKAYQQYIPGSPEFQLTGYLLTPFLRQKKFLPPGISFSMRMIRNDSNLLFQTASTSNVPVLRIKDAYFSLKRLQLTPRAQEEQNQMVVRSRVLRFPLETHQMIKLNMQANNTVFHFHQALTGEIPRRGILGFVRDESSEKGSSTRHPFYFEDIKIKEMRLIYDNKVYPSPNGYKYHYSANPNEKQMLNKELYRRVMSVYHENIGKSALSYEKWLERMFFLTFDFTAQCDAKKVDGYVQPSSVGDIRWEIELYEPLQHSMMALFLAERDCTVLISIPTLIVQVED